MQECGERCGALEEDVHRCGRCGERGRTEQRRRRRNVVLEVEREEWGRQRRSVVRVAVGVGRGATIQGREKNK